MPSDGARHANGADVDVTHGHSQTSGPQRRRE